MSSKELKPCPFCGFHPSVTDDDCIYPVTMDRKVWSLHCYETGGGCSAAVLGGSPEECIALWNTRAQLAAIQGGMGEEVEVAAFLMEPDLYEPYVSLRRDSQCQGSVKPLMTVAQYQRITAAMAAELADAKSARDAYGQNAIDLQKQRDALRAELAEVKGREAVPVGHIGKSHGYKERFPIWNTPDGSEPPIGTKLYTTPPSSPDVEGLVNELQRIAEKCSDPDTTDALDTALSTWRQAQV